ncbi:hypothetical protein C4579_03180 [Candidatus Microgenomates bacterium]|nr:MAG: hypothetical protein C4579_03180 [Candidatus Microgenomates bacterium]
MNKTVMAVVGIAVVGALAAGAYFMLKPSSTSPTGSNPLIPGQANNAAMGNSSSFRSLMNLVGNQRCTFSDDMGNSGVVYGSSGSVRGDFQGTTANNSIQTHMISDGNMMYLWFDGESSGFKGSLADIESMNAQTQGSTKSQKSVDLDKQVDYDCQGWTVDNSLFVPPSNVTFTDYSQMMQGMPGAMMEGESGAAMEAEGSTDVKAMQCAACESLPGDAQTQCKQALGC